MQDRHVTHLINRYISGQLSPTKRARVVNHVRTCAKCRAALARQERVTGDLRREAPALGYVPTSQLSDIWAGVWQDVGAQRWRDRLPISAWLPGVTVAVVMLIVLAVAVPLLGDSDLRVEAAPLSNRPISTASPTPGLVETEEADGAAALILPQATVALVSGSAVTPAPVPGVIVSPEVQGSLGAH